MRVVWPAPVWDRDEKSASTLRRVGDLEAPSQERGMPGLFERSECREAIFEGTAAEREDGYS